MELLIKNVTIIRPGNRKKSSKKDIYIKNGIIQKIGSKLSIEGIKVVESNDLHVSPGWFDVGTQIGEPGFEHRETIDSVAKAAAKGGFTGIACFPNTNPVVDTKSAVHFIKSNSSRYATTFYPIAALSAGVKGTDITEMIDLHQNGAIGFSDGSSSVQNSGILLRALQYVKSFGGCVLQKSIDEKIANHGQVHEGDVSIQLGLSGVPSIAETSSLQKDLELNRYAESKIIFHTISSEGSCKVIKAAKKNKDRVFATVSYLNLIENDEVLLNFDSNFKVDPPLRSSKDQNALIKAVKDDTIDAICSNHVPLEEERKKLEFSYADQGAIGLQTLFPAIYTALSSKLSLNDLVKKLSLGPRRLFGLPEISIKAGEKAELTLFDPSLSWTFDKKDNQSKSNNSPYLGRTFDGKVLGIINGKNISLS